MQIDNMFLSEKNAAETESASAAVVTISTISSIQTCAVICGNANESTKQIFYFNFGRYAIVV